MEGGEIRCWDELIPDALGLIFSKLSLKEKLTVIPRICKPWSKALMGPYSWQEIDIAQWCYDHYQPELLDRMLRMLIGFSGSPRELSVYNIPNDAIFSFIADHAGSLETLQIPYSQISDSIVEKVAGRMCAITFLDLSYCYNIGPRALEAFGRNCRLLSGLRRAKGSFCSVNEEAHAIATTMPELKHLEINYMLITAEGVFDIISGCPKLVYLDVRNCRYSKVSEKFLKEKYPGLNVPLYYFYDEITFENLPTTFSSVVLEMDVEEDMWDYDEDL
ncbi:F-box protein FBW2-like [Macadamia integrifolia]|uniref:F-box protein FBW2-like n=1 Tax=Macadamia integrifolia TaxID=60698 RepID=UPI001C4F3188|nr:F-box protein FBW2-like [Macadamia integrifolia]XP_042475911.1 F-box protein FBW2-like [Macadamia integrifolia]XP_042475921.1 F-box protein FBW2-like [Macadamia integrifolia]